LESLLGTVGLDMTKEGVKTGKKLTELQGESSVPWLRLALGVTEFELKLRSDTAV